jgi:hypothetical protein
MAEDGEVVVLFPLPPAAAADRAIVLAGGAINTANRAVDSDTDLLIIGLVTEGGVLAEKNLNFRRSVESTLVRPTAGRKRPCLQVGQVA